MAASELRQLLEQADQHRVQGEYEAALPLYEQALQAEPVNLQARLGLGHCLLNTGEFDRGLEHFRQAASDHPRSPEAHLLLARMLLMLGFDEEGQAELRRVLEFDPDNAEVRRYLSYL